MKLNEYLKMARQSPEPGDKTQYMSMRDKMTSCALVNSQKEIPCVSCTYDADVTKLFDVFSRLKNECGYKLTFNSLMLKILVEGLKSAPKLNAHYKYNHRSLSGRLIIKKHIDVSMPVCTESGETFQIKLLQLENKSLKDTAFAAEDAVKRIQYSDLDEVMFEVSRQRVIGEMTRGRIISPLRQTLSASFGKGKVVHLSQSLKSDFKKISGRKNLQEGYDVKMEELNEGTVCFTNWGTLYDNLNVNITQIPPIYPQVFLFATGRIKDENHVYEDENGNICLKTRKILPMSLNFDHKIGGAADLIPFIKKIDEILENPEIIYTW